MKVKAIHIDAENQTVSDVELESESDTSFLSELYKYTKCNCICSGWTWYDDQSIPRAVLYVDDEGAMNGTTISFLLHSPSGVGGLRCNPMGPTPLMGSGIITGVSESGETIDVPFAARDLSVAWPILF